MSWFEGLMGFPERDFNETRARMRLEEDRLISEINGASYGVGTFSLRALEDLRKECSASPMERGRLRVSNISADVRALHRAPENEGALFQVASQFNMLEMISPDVTPERGVGIYERDPTQGPACAIAAGGATIFRNYLVPHAGETGQTAERQIDGSAGLAAALADVTGLAPETLWTMRNGYALFRAEGLSAIDDALAGLDEAARDLLRSRLAVGLHEEVEVTDRPARPGQRVSQVFCSALPVLYNHAIQTRSSFRRFATLVLEAAYEATLCAGLRSFSRGGPGVVFLTSLGGGAFGNDEQWIVSAMRRALSAAHEWPLDVRLVSYREPSRALLALEQEFSWRG